uniref:Uncharacterized protein n=1 Tax=Bactrocera latifrons TaxID=174628 RepID=A0A0K8UNI1_BACLA
MDTKQNTGALAVLAKLAKKVIVCNTHETPETPRPTIQRIYMQDECEYTTTPTTAFKCTKGRRLNFNDSKLLEELYEEDESDYDDDETTPKRGRISLQSLGQIFCEWTLFGFDQTKDGRKTAKEEKEQRFDKTNDFMSFKQEPLTT